MCVQGLEKWKNVNKKNKIKKIKKFFCLVKRKNERKKIVLFFFHYIRVTGGKLLKPLQ